MSGINNVLRLLAQGQTTRKINATSVEVDVPLAVRALGLAVPHRLS